MRQTEHIDQRQLVAWAKAQAGAMPELELLMAYPAGGYRSKATAGKMKAEGQRSGVLDLFLPVARGGYFGLWIEMKAPGDSGGQRGRLSKAQEWWIEKLEDQGYRVVVAYGFDQGKDALLRYLKGYVTIGA